MASDVLPLGRGLERVSAGRCTVPARRSCPLPIQVCASHRSRHRAACPRTARGIRSLGRQANGSGGTAAHAHLAHGSIGALKGVGTAWAHFGHTAKIGRNAGTRLTFLSASRERARNGALAGGVSTHQGSARCRACSKCLIIGSMARPRGFEPLTSTSGGWRSIRLSYGRIT